MGDNNNNNDQLPPATASAPRSRRNSLFNPLPYNPDLLDMFNFHGTARPRRPSFGGTLSLGGIDLIPSSGMAEAADSSVFNLESQFCKDFECCGTQFPSLHELLSHYETVHVNVKDFSTFSPTTLTSSELSPMLDSSNVQMSLAGLEGGHHASSMAKLETIQEEESDALGTVKGMPAGLLHQYRTNVPMASPSPVPASMNLSHPDMFPSPVPSNATLPIVNDLQEGLRHLHIEQQQDQQQDQQQAGLLFAPYATPGVGYQQQGNGLVPPESLYYPPNTKRARAPSLVAMNLPPDEAKKLKGNEGNHRYPALAPAVEDDASGSSPSTSHASAPETPKIGHNGVEYGQQGTDHIDDILASMQAPNSSHAEFLQQNARAQQAAKSSPLLSHPQLPQQQLQQTFSPIAQPRPRAHPGAASQQMPQFSGPPVEQHRVSPHLAHLAFVSQGGAVGTPPPRPNSTPVGAPGMYSSGQQLQQQNPAHPPSSTPPPGSWMNGIDGQDMMALVDDMYGAAGMGSGPGRRYKCPKPLCSKIYKNSNGLKYHLEHGNCELEYQQQQQQQQQQQHQQPSQQQQLQQQQSQQQQQNSYSALAPPHPDFSPFYAPESPTVADFSGQPSMGNATPPPPQFLNSPQAGNRPLPQQHQQQQHLQQPQPSPQPQHQPPPQHMNPYTSPMLHAHSLPPHMMPMYHPHHQMPHPGMHPMQHPHQQHPQFPHHMQFPPHMQGGLPVGYPLVGQDIKIALRPYWCRVPSCGKKYKNLNGLKYHAKVTHADLDFKTQVKGHTSMSL
ncbi:hypothetical protein PhCBS80983_g04208 [Powellomyces hirtus]|uniref:C2H2-type domain-containing protein n=1 Tax=Powellomyces hirtus TaxID=109895 RepID=A0A507E140_9FUNG|nr:hypothetical protein PhCBS80983_g04208 [Powellomyces hirtus]